MPTNNVLEVVIGETRIPYSIRESSKSKRMTIHLTPDSMEVVVPVNSPENKILRFVDKKRSWIYEKREELIEKAYKLESSHPSHYRTGAKILYRGRMMKLRVERNHLDDLKVGVFYRNGFYVTVPESFSSSEKDLSVRLAIEEWIKDRVKIDVESFVRQYGGKLSLYPKGIKIKEQKHLWGSCGRDDIININWKLGRAPKRVLEYVVAHELCHLGYRNHSDEFWTLLRSVFADVDECKVWLDENGEENYSV